MYNIKVVKQIVHDVVEEKVKLKVRMNRARCSEENIRSVCVDTTNRRN